MMKFGSFVLFLTTLFFGGVHAEEQPLTLEVHCTKESVTVKIKSKCKADVKVIKKLDPGFSVVQIISGAGKVIFPDTSADWTLQLSDIVTLKAGEFIEAKIPMKRFANVPVGSKVRLRYQVLKDSFFLDAWVKRLFTSPGPDFESERSFVMSLWFGVEESGEFIVPDNPTDTDAGKNEDAQAAR